LAGKGVIYLFLFPDRSEGLLKGSGRLEILAKWLFDLRLGPLSVRELTINLATPFAGYTFLFNPCATGVKTLGGKAI
jgi:hypothetical protein